MPFSPQQQAVIDWVPDGTGSVFVEAVAGSGKTTTLIGALPDMQGSVAFAAYNAKIVKEIKQKLINKADRDHVDFNPAYLGINNRVNVKTFHGFGFQAWSRIYPNAQLDDIKKSRLTASELNIPKVLQPLVFKLVGLAKQSLGGLAWQVDDHANWYRIVDHFDLAYEIEDESLIARTIEFSIKALRFHYKVGKELISFDDMLWLPIIAGCKIQQNDWVIVDEAQDTNPARRALARKMLKAGGRSMWVGDRHQAIYGFTGADADSIDQIVRDFNCKELPLTVTFRCPKAVVAKAQEVVSHVQAHESAPEGEVRYLNEQDFWMVSTAMRCQTCKDGCFDPSGCTDCLNTGWEQGIEGFHPTNDAILCRNTKPLVKMAYQLIKRGIACHVEGRDIGLGLVKLVNRFNTNDLHDLASRLEDYRDKEVEKLIAKGKETAAEALSDRVETVQVMMEDKTLKTVIDLQDRIYGLFLDGDKETKPTLTLCTCHRSKGREWKRVFLYGKEAYMPSKYARQAWQMEQEANLVYVSYTRAMSELILVQAAE